MWLNPGRWILYAALIGALCLGVWRLDQSRQQIGYDRAQAEYTAKALQASEAARAKEAQLQTNAARLSNELYQANKRHADAVSALDDTERMFHATIADSPSTSTGTATYASPGPERELLGNCAKTLVRLAKEADGLEIQVVGLQKYVTEICLATKTH